MSTSDGRSPGEFEPADPDSPPTDHDVAATPGPNDAGDTDRPPAATVAPQTGLGHTRAAAAWTGLVIGTLVLILLLVFILQNLDSVTWNLFWWEFSLPLGVSLLLAAIAGALIMALAGGVRIMQIRKLAKHAATPR